MPSLPRSDSLPFFETVNPRYGPGVTLRLRRQAPPAGYCPAPFHLQARA